VFGFVSVAAVATLQFSFDGLGKSRILVHWYLDVSLARRQGIVETGAARREGMSEGKRYLRVERVLKSVLLDPAASMSLFSWR